MGERATGGRGAPTARILAPLVARRTRAYLRDCLGYLALAAALLPIGIPLALHIESPSTARLVGLSTSAIPPVLAALWAARAESTVQGRTWGKRREGLRVVRHQGAVAHDAGERVPFARALVRNAVKIAIPWQLGHVVAVGAAYGDFDTGAPGTIVAAALLYPLVIVLIGSGVLGSGRGLHDRIAGTQVVDDRG